MKEDAESTSEGNSNGFAYTGVSLWTSAVNHAEEWNPDATREVLKEIAHVDALQSSTNIDGYEIVPFDYAQQELAL